MDGAVKDGLQYTHRFASQSDIVQPIPNNHVRNLADQFQYAARDKASRVTDTVLNLPDRIGKVAQSTSGLADHQSAIAGAAGGQDAYDGEETSQCGPDDPL